MKLLHAHRMWEARFQVISSTARPRWVFISTMQGNNMLTASGDDVFLKNLEQFSL